MRSKPLNQLWPSRIVLLMVVAFILLAVTSCASNWYGTGTVVEKTHRASYLSYCGKGCFVMIPECFQLTVEEYNGDTHTGCVREKVWEDAMLGHQITLTENTHY